MRRATIRPGFWALLCAAAAACSPQPPAGAPSSDAAPGGAAAAGRADGGADQGGAAGSGRTAASESAAEAQAAEAGGAWGDLSIRFVYGGDPPPQAPLEITADREFCCQHQVLDESLVVNPDNRGVANVVVSLHLARGQASPPVHPDYAATAEAQVPLDNDKCRFDPHVVLLRTTQTLVIGNKDPIGHNTKIDTFSNPPINVVTPAGGEQTHRFLKPERLPAARVSCNIHPWMSGWVVIKDHPYMGVSDRDGLLTIKNLPAGEWTFLVWQEKAGYVTEARRGDEVLAWPRGRAVLEIRPGRNDLGDVVLDPALFARP